MSFCYFNLAWISKFNHERKNKKKDSGRKSKKKRSCKWPICGEFSIVPVVYNPRNSWSSDTYIFSSLVFGFHRYVFEFENIVLEARNVSWLWVTRKKINIYRIKGKLFIQKRAKNKPLFKTYSKMKSVHIKVHVVRTTLPFEEWISDTFHKQLSSLVFTTLQFRKAKMPTFNLCHVAIAFEFLTSDIEYCSWSKVKSPSILLNAS